MWIFKEIAKKCMILSLYINKNNKLGIGREFYPNMIKIIERIKKDLIHKNVRNLAKIYQDGKVDNIIIVIHSSLI